jgi:hypothetical protein
MPDDPRGDSINRLATTDPSQPDVARIAVVVAVLSDGISGSGRRAKTAVRLGHLGAALRDLDTAIESAERAKKLIGEVIAAVPRSD